MKGLLFLGTENALYFSPDDGQHWHALQSGLPHAPVHWLTIQEHFNDLVVATYGRGFWILDDITPVRQLSAQTLSTNAHLFTPRPAYRFRTITEPFAMPDDATEGQNPPDGAAINFFLKSAPAKDADGQIKKDAVKLVVSDSGGKTVRTLEVGKNATAGINRVWWDLREDPTRDLKLRTSPLYAPEFKVGPDGTRKFPTGAPLSILVPPGTYSVKLMTNGQESTEPLVVRKDPNTTGTEADIQAQTRALRQVRENVNVVTDLINQAESIRAQLEHLKTLVSDDDTGKAIKTSADDLDKKIVAVESHLFNMTATGRGQDQLRMPSEMFEKLSHLADVVSLNDFPPTDQALEVHETFTKEINGYRDQMARVVGSDVASFNNVLRDRKVGGGIVVVK
jgi:hypothetical protein